jgi:hypothetical protein
VVHWYRETKDSPLHALEAELCVGNDRVAKIEPVHCLGLMELQVKTVLLRILGITATRESNVVIGGGAGAIENAAGDDVVRGG